MNSATLLALMKSNEDSPINVDDVLRRLEIDKLDVGVHYLDIEEYAEKYTLMQFAAKNGMENFVVALLKYDVNPNFPSRKVNYKHKNRKVR